MTTICKCGHDSSTHNRRWCQGIVSLENGQPVPCICDKSHDRVLLDEAREIINQQKLCLSILDETSTNKQFRAHLAKLNAQADEFLNNL